MWTVQGDNDFDTEREKSVNLDSKASATLHALSFREREANSRVDAGGGRQVMAYSQLTSCSPRFHFILDSDKLDSGFQAVGSLCIASYTLEDPSAAGRAAEDAADSYNNADNPDGLLDRLGDNDSDHSGLVSNSGLSVFLWQVYARNVSKPRYFIGVFDLNGWYQAQMPSRVAAAEDGVKCSYFSICDMDDVVAVSEALSDRAPGSGFNNPR